MPSIGTALLDCLNSVERPGDFCAGGVRHILMPAIDVDGVGRLAFPLLPEQVERLVAVAEAAPYGRGAATIFNREVRRTWQIDPGRIRIGGRHWPQASAELVAEAAQGLGIGEGVSADFYKLLVYDAGSFFVDHRDTEKLPGMFATMAIVLPSAYRGGELIVRHLGREVVLDLHPEEPSEIGFAAFYADCVHEVRPVTAGCRVALVYNLRFAGDKPPPTAPDYRVERRRAAEQLKRWTTAADEPDKLVLPLDHAYTPAELSFRTLKARDAGVASVLVDAAAEADCDLHLALVTIEESGSAIASGYRGRRRHWGSRDEDDVEFEVEEVIDGMQILSDWRRPDCAAAGLGEIPFDEDELCPTGAFNDLEPDEQHFHEATGNEGASFERSYRRAALVLWPSAWRLKVLNAAGLAATLPYLAELTARWEASGAERQSPLWREADELSRHMLGSWPRQTWRPQDDTAPTRMLDLQVRLGNAAPIDAFLTEFSAEGHYQASDNKAILRAAALLPRPRAGELLARIVRRNAAAHLGGCGDLLRRAVAADLGIDAVPIAEALLAVLPGDMAKAAPPDFRTPPPAPATPSFVVDLVAATSRIDGRLATRAVDHLLAWPETYEADRVLVPVALAFVGEPESASWPAVARLRTTALVHLLRRIALPLEPPRDWARTNSLSCDCADCRELGLFLVDPRQPGWHLKAAEARRRHIQENVRHARCDLDLRTERRGSPHTLVAVKNEASYQRRVQERRRDLEHVSALGG